MTKRRYRIVGIVEEPALVRLVLQNEEPVTAIPAMNMNDTEKIMAGDYTKIINTVAVQMQAKMGRDTICISYDDQKREKYDRGQIITINIEK